MGFVKNETQADVRRFDSFPEAQAVLEDARQPLELRVEALDYMIRHQEIYYVLDILSKLFAENRTEDHPLIDFAFAQFSHRPRREKDFEALFRMLKSDNAYLRNAAITFLQAYGEEAKGFLEQLLRDEDRDVRIFAANILGDVRFEDSVEMLRALMTHEIAHQRDVNVLMTAADYMGEIGSEEDIALLEAVKQEFSDNPYVSFGIDMAIARIRGEA